MYDINILQTEVDNVYQHTTRTIYNLHFNNSELFVLDDYEIAEYFKLIPPNLLVKSFGLGQTKGPENLKDRMLLDTLTNLSYATNIDTDILFEKYGDNLVNYIDTIISIRNHILYTVNNQNIYTDIGSMFNSLINNDGYLPTVIKLVYINESMIVFDEYKF